jgi:hypothetical protein
LLYVFTCLYNYIDFILCAAYFVFVLNFPHPGLYRIYGNKDDDDDDGVELLILHPLYKPGYAIPHVSNLTEKSPV